jgi:para-nitrobenzyl esterase
VIVTINYRLGPLGFFRLIEVTGGRIPATGNEGILDQIAALEWVRNNIRAFGGDPENVTVFGESAGGMSIGVLLAMPRAKGLFRRAILQSGAAHTIHRPEQSNAFAQRVLGTLEINELSPERLRSLTPEQLIVASLKTTQPGSTPFQPVIEGNQIPVHPIEAVRGGSADGIAILAGSNLEEWKLFASMDPTLPSLSEAGLITQLKAIMPGVDVNNLIDTYRHALMGRGEPTKPAAIITAIGTDRRFRVAAIRLIESQEARGNPAYNYLFTWPSPILGGLLGSCHALEVGFVFGTTSANAQTESFYGVGPEVNALSEKMQDAWIAFARKGNPSCEGLGKWPMYGKNRATMVLGRTSGMKTAVLEEERLAYDGIPDAVIGSF